MGKAAFSKTKAGAVRPRIRPKKHSTETPGKPHSIYRVERKDWIEIPVPPIVSEQLYEAVQAQLDENKKRARCGERTATNIEWSPISVGTVEPLVAQRFAVDATSALGDLLICEDRSSSEGLNDGAHPMVLRQVFNNIICVSFGMRIKIVWSRMASTSQTFSSACVKKVS